MEAVAKSLYLIKMLDSDGGRGKSTYDGDLNTLFVSRELGKSEVKKREKMMKK